LRLCPQCVYLTGAFLLVPIGNFLFFPFPPSSSRPFFCTARIPFRPMLPFLHHHFLTPSISSDPPTSAASLFFPRRPCERPFFLPSFGSFLDLTFFSVIRFDSNYCGLSSVGSFPLVRASTPVRGVGPLSLGLRFTLPFRNPHNFALAPRRPFSAFEKFFFFWAPAFPRFLTSTCAVATFCRRALPSFSCPPFQGNALERFFRPNPVCGSPRVSSIRPLFTRRSLLIPFILPGLTLFFFFRKPEIRTHSAALFFFSYAFSNFSVFIVFLPDPFHFFFNSAPCVPAHLLSVLLC